jgi:hypothetical protein
MHPSWSTRNPLRAVTISPDSRRESANTTMACCRHADRLIPVSWRNSRVKARRLMCRATAQSSMVSREFGFAKNRRYFDASRAWLGIGTHRGS